MALPISDYALLSDTESAALVGKDGSVDWLTFPRFDSPASFAALLGTPDHGRWLLAPAEKVTEVHRRYRPGTLVLETEMTTASGTVVITEAMPPRDQGLELVRLVEGHSGRVPMRMHLTARMDYGSIIPWVRRVDDGLSLVAGPDALRLRTPIHTHGADHATVAEFTVDPGDRVGFELAWHPSHREPGPPIDVAEAIEQATNWWCDWTDTCQVPERYEAEVRSSMTVLKGLTYAPTGGVVAAPTTSLPEEIGGARNWDYRYCWLRDATFCLLALLRYGYTSEAKAWREWLLRAVAGRPERVQIMYGPAGERRLTETELDWLPGYEGSAPVRSGNGAHDQFQLDVFGEVLDAMHQARVAGIGGDGPAWALESKLVDIAEDRWGQPDDGIWEVRGGQRHFTHSKVMAWVALDRAVRSAERFGLDAPLDRWRATRADIHADVLAHGVDGRGVFTQSYDTSELDASLLMVPLVGFLAPDDERVVNTVDAIERELTEDGFVYRYRTGSGADGVEGGEATFLMCTFWLTNCLALMGRTGEATERFERLLGLRNDVGLLAEEYEPSTGRMLGNFPQAFSHVSLLNTAATINSAAGESGPRCVESEHHEDRRPQRGAPDRA